MTSPIPRDRMTLSVIFNLDAPIGWSLDDVADHIREIVITAAGSDMLPRNFRAHPGDQTDVGLLVIRTDTPPGGVTMISGDGVMHLTAADLEPDPEP